MRIELEDVDYVTETTVTIRETRRRTTVPKVLAERLDLHDGDKLRWILFKDDMVLLSRGRTRD
jgi:bifunctional DNA-binding transcriptional regulator/antitoxin component of YhaV-PrlF toxin-antitoxin module